MRLRSAGVLPFVAALLVGTAATPARADDPCAGFKWDVSKERALFAASVQPQAQPAGRDGTGRPSSCRIDYTCCGSRRSTR